MTIDLTVLSITHQLGEISYNCILSIKSLSLLYIPSKKYLLSKVQILVDYYSLCFIFILYNFNLAHRGITQWTLSKAISSSLEFLLPCTGSVFVLFYQNVTLTTWKHMNGVYLQLGKRKSSIMTQTYTIYSYIVSMVT